MLLCVVIDNSTDIPQSQLVLVSNWWNKISTDKWHHQWISRLKFVMQPRPAKLTTTQHNFNPIIFWGGGSQTLPPGLTLPIFLGRGATSIELNCVCCQNPTQLNSTQPNSKATSVGVRHSSQVYPYMLWNLPIYAVEPPPQTLLLL